LKWEVMVERGDDSSKKKKFDPFSCFREGNVIRKSCEESAESETRGQFS
jgi:hypothetical protein